MGVNHKIYGKNCYFLFKNTKSSSFLIAIVYIIMYTIVNYVINEEGAI